MTDIPELDGPTFGPVAGGAPRKLVVLLHGFGANGDDLIGLAPALAQVLPDVKFIAPHAPFPCPQAPPTHYQWFDVWDRDTARRLAGGRKAAVIVDAFLDAKLAEHKLTDADLALIGFSQGTMVSLHVGLRRPKPCAGILGYSGRLEFPDLLAAELKSRPPVLLIHGDEDPVVPFEQLAIATEALKENGVPVEAHTRPGLGHAIDIDGIKLGAAFLATVLSGH
jgi:phospholipase/carboxylesterase